MGYFHFYQSNNSAYLYYNSKMTFEDFLQHTHAHNGVKGWRKIFSMLKGRFLYQNKKFAIVVSQCTGIDDNRNIKK